MTTFNPLIPPNSDSPGLFPAQSRQNFTRLQQLLGADHQFNDTAAENDGYHNLIHMSIQAPTDELAATGRLYVKIVSGLVQLFYMDDAGTEYLITPQYLVTPIRVTGSQSFIASEVVSVLNESYDYTGIGTVYVNGLTGQATYNFIKTGTSTVLNLINSTNPTIGPILQFTGTDLQVKNNTPGTLTLVWSLIINRTT